jgi:L-lactate permease
MEESVFERSRDQRRFHPVWIILPMLAALTVAALLSLAGVLNCSGVAASLADAFSKVGVACILVAPILGWIGVMPGYLILVGFLFCHLMPQATMP